ncbi:MAG TPA: hypothetical protein VG916_11575 [Gemmatimonadaceae bacterium]|nr:hypothetical protein [Gemmatimonadaceae bacterium]
MTSRLRLLMRTTTTSALGALLVLLPRAAVHAQAAPVDFSGVIYPQFRMQTDDATKNANGGNATSRFDVERVYLTFKMPAGDDGSIRVTTDIFNNGASCSGCYAGWNIRLKYAYFNYNFLHDINGQKGFNAAVRFGMVHTPVVDLEEGFFPRYISQTAVERNGFFSSSDVGVAGVLTLPSNWGELFATITNGGGYGTVEQDPYKDYAARLALTPWGGGSNMLKTFTIAPWFYAGKTASKYLTTAGSAGTDAANGLTKDRAGVFIGLRDRRLTAGVDIANRTETVETGTSLATRGTYDNTGALTSGFVLVRPMELFASDPKAKSPWGILARVDNYKPYDNTAAAGAQTTSATNQLLIYGVWWDLNQKASVSLDVQNLKPQSGSTTPESKVLFLHGQINF